MAAAEKLAMKNSLTVDTTISKENIDQVETPKTAASTPTTSVAVTTPDGIRGSTDLRSPGMNKTPAHNEAPIPDFITQTDANGNAVTPRTPDAIKAAKEIHPTGPEPKLHVNKNGKLTEEEDDNDDELPVDACETLLDSIRLMCCCLLPEDSPAATARKVDGSPKRSFPQDMEAAPMEETKEVIKLLPKHHPDDRGKKCLVLDLDETLVHSSFRAVQGADFVIPVQIEDVVHFVYVAKRPGVDEFLTEMAKHYEIVVYTASLNKYADPLLDLLDPNRVIRTRLFRESCVFYEGNYVKDLSLLDRDLSQSIIIDNSPSSYLFHPENAIDCSSFIDDIYDRELQQIANFLVGVKDVKDVRNVCHLWRDWPQVHLGEEESTYDATLEEDAEERTSQ